MRWSVPAAMYALIVGIVMVLPVCAQSDATEQAHANADGQVVEQAAPKTVADGKETAWSMLTTAVEDQKHAELRVQAVAALGLLGDSPRSLEKLRNAMLDADVDVRTAAVLAAGATRSRTMTGALRRMLDDKEPQVAYGAALTLWHMNDRSGEDILMAVVEGERRSAATLQHGTMHTVSKDLHSPSTLAKIGALEGATMLLGPFGFGITAYEYVRKNGGGSARVAAIEALAEEKTGPIRKELIAAMDDKDAGVRAAALKGVAGYREAAIATAIATHFDDAKAPVRLTAAAAYLINTEAAPGVSAGNGANGPKAMGAKTATRRRSQ